MPFFGSGDELTFITEEDELKALAQRIPTLRQATFVATHCNAMGAHRPPEQYSGVCSYLLYSISIFEKVMSMTSFDVTWYRMHRQAAPLQPKHHLYASQFA